MKKLALLILTAFVSTATLGQQKENRNVSDFTYISFGISGDLTIIQGSKTEVILEGDQDDLDKIEAYVSGNELKIRSKNKSWSSGKTGKVKATITLKDFTGVSLSGSGNVNSKGMLKGDNVELSVSGSGDMSLDIEARDIESHISGSGSIALRGVGKKASLSISGSGKLEATDFEVANMSIRISGSGGAAIFVTEELESRISGSGTVRYKGDPDKVSNHASGSGKLRKM